MTIFVHAAMLVGTVKVKMNGTCMDFKPPEFIAHFNSKYIERYVAKVNSLNVFDPYNPPGVLFRNTETAGNASVMDL